MLIVSREIGSRPLGVILTARRAVFIWGDTEVMVPWRMVPLPVSGVAGRSFSRVGHTVLELDRYSFVRAFHEEPVDTVGSVRRSAKKSWAVDFSRAP